MGRELQIEQPENDYKVFSFVTVGNLYTKDPLGRGASILFYDYPVYSR